MDASNSFALHALESFASRLPTCPRELGAWLGTVKLNWGYSIGLEYAQLPHEVVPLDVKKAAEQFPAVEYEIIRVVGDVPLHYHTRSGGMIKILPSPIEGIEAYLKYEKEEGRWHSIPSEGEAIRLPAGTVHGFRHKNEYGLFVLSVNFPPITPEDITYV